MAGGSTRAAAAGTADLSVSQVVSNGTGSGNTTVTDHIHNAGPSTATDVVATALLKTSGGSVSYTTSNATCEQQPAPSGWTFMFTCQLALAEVRAHLDPQVQPDEQQRGSVHPFRERRRKRPRRPFPGQQLFHPQQLLRVASGPFAVAEGYRRLVGRQGHHHDSIRNAGPWTANNLQQVIEINSPTFSGVGASSNLSGASCLFIPPASGFNAAVSCTIGSLVPGGLWKLTFDYTGGPGGSLVQQGTITAASPTDPVPGNNTASTTASYHS